MLYDVIHSSQARRIPGGPGAVSFLYNHGGLNNQKMAIAGLLLSSVEHCSRVNLPYIYLKDQRTDEEYLARFEDVFDLDTMHTFGERNGIDIHAECPSGDRGGWDHFARFGQALYEGPDRNTVRTALDAMISLKPRINNHPTFRQLKQFVFASLGIQTTIQLRIEHDWKAHAENLRSVMGDSEDYAIGFVEILSKVKRSLPDLKLAYVTSDENSMPNSRDEIRAFSRSQFGIDLLWKTDLLSQSHYEVLNPLDLSLVDYEIARYCRQFVGLTNSTFSNMLCLEKFAATGKDVTGHFIYNALGDGLVERRDNGFTAAAHLAVLPSRIAGLLAEHDLG